MQGDSAVDANKGVHMSDAEQERDKAQEVVGFWREAGPAKWFAKSDAFDDEIRMRFAALHERAASGALAAWESSAEGALALLLLLDQIPRNLYRDSAHAFASDPMALNIARRAWRAGFDNQCGEDMRPFFYMPFMHSEAIGDQDLCVALCRAHKLEDNISFAEDHRDIIARFGRFPHRNRVMGRETSKQEQAFLDDGGFAG